MRSFFTKRKNIISILTGAFFVFCPFLYSQETVPANKNNGQNEVVVIDDNIAIDTAQREHKHSPKIATISSAIVPGLGQIYNQKYWKVPIIWGAGLGMYFYVDYSNTLYHRCKLAYEQLNRDETVSDPDLSDWSLSKLQTRKNTYRKNRDRAIIFTGLIYVANILDAMVDAHMLDYDISQDLTLHWEPSLMPIDNYSFANSAVGVNIQIRF